MYRARFLLDCNKVVTIFVEPSKEHHTAVKHVPRYIKGTPYYKLYCRKSEKLSVVGYSDADWASSVDDRKSTTGYCFRLNENPGMISWKSRKQGTVALSSCEVEYMGLAAATQEGWYLL